MTRVLSIYPSLFLLRCDSQVWVIQTNRKKGVKDTKGEYMAKKTKSDTTKEKKRSTKSKENSEKCGGNATLNTEKCAKKGEKSMKKCAKDCSTPQSSTKLKNNAHAANTESTRNLRGSEATWGITWSNEKRGDVKGTLKEALDKADAGLKQFKDGTHQNLIVYDWDSDNGAVRKWHWGKFDKNMYEAMKDPIEFGSTGWLGDWEIVRVYE